MVVECPVAVPLASISPPALPEEARRRDDSGRGRRRVEETGAKRDDVGTLNAAADETHHAPIMSPGLIASTNSARGFRSSAQRRLACAVRPPHRVVHQVEVPAVEGGGKRAGGDNWRPGA